MTTINLKCAKFPKSGVVSLPTKGLTLLDWDIGTEVEIIYNNHEIHIRKAPMQTTENTRYITQSKCLSIPAEIRKFASLDRNKEYNMLLNLYAEEIVLKIS